MIKGFNAIETNRRLEVAMRFYPYLTAILIFLNLSVTLSAQTRYYTRPNLPSETLLGRMGLKIAWSTKIPMDGAKDSIESIQVLPNGEGTQLLIQTRFGLVQLMDGETGDLIWQSTVGLPYKPMQSPVYNDHSIYVFRSDLVYSLDRKTGKHRFYKFEKRTGFISLGYELIYAPTGQPVADNAVLFVPHGERMSAYFIPLLSNSVPISSKKDFLFNPPRTLKAPGKLVFSWNERVLGVNIVEAPLLSGEKVNVIGENGVFAAINKKSGELDYQYGFGGPVNVPMGQYGDIAYVGSQDFMVYALQMEIRKLLWRFPAGARITEPVMVTKNDVFVSTKRKGMFRLNREDGKRLWNSKTATQFLSTSGRFVYARDPRGKFLVLDYLRGRTLAQLDLQRFHVPVRNTYTDRIYLGNHDGTLFCMHDGNLPDPVFNRDQGEPKIKQPMVNQ